MLQLLLLIVVLLLVLGNLAFQVIDLHSAFVARPEAVLVEHTKDEQEDQQRCPIFVATNVVPKRNESSHNRYLIPYFL